MAAQLIVIYGPARSGKTTYLESRPEPKIVLDRTDPLWEMFHAPIPFGFAYAIDDHTSLDSRTEENIVWLLNEGTNVFLLVQDYSDLSDTLQARVTERVRTSWTPSSGFGVKTTRPEGTKSG